MKLWKHRIMFVDHISSQVYMSKSLRNIFCFFVENSFMPFTQSYEQINHVELHLMHYIDFDPKDFEDQLTDEEKERLFSFRSIKRQREFTATRVLRHSIFGFSHIHYTAIGSPYIPGEGNISISHAPGIVGIAVSTKNKIALDLERISDKAKQLHSKFLNDREIKELNCLSAVEMTKAWSAKEVLYKLAETKGLDFKRNLILFPDGDSFFGEIHTSTGIKQVKLLSKVEQDLVITFNRIE